MPWLSRFSCCIFVLTTQFAWHVQAQTENTSAKPPVRANKAAAPKVTQPVWADLRPEQQSALAPLQTEWHKLSEARKQKWLEISNNFGKLQPEEQSKLHSRMKEWVTLSPQQRAQARLNFSTAKTLTPAEKQKQWEAYQALSPAEKQKLAAKANTPNSAALANKPQNKTLPISKLQPSPAVNPSPAPAK